MKTSIEVIEHEINKPESVLKRTNATKLDIAMLADHLRVLHADTSSGLDREQERIRALDDKVAAAEDVIHSIGDSIGQFQHVVHAVKGALDVHARDLATAIEVTEHEQRERIAAIDNRLTAIGEHVSLADEKRRTADDEIYRNSAAIQGRVQTLEERIPSLEMEIVSLGDIVDRIERVQQTINARLLLVMRMSLMMIGVLVATVVILGLIFYRF